ncbi:4-alpha-glucanotransferase, partial [Streptomyces sp. NPDC059744]
MGLSRLAALHGVATSYAPSADVTVSVPDDTVVAVLAALGVDAATPEAVRESLAAAEAVTASRLLPPTLVVWSGEPLPPALTALRPGTTLEIEPEDAVGSCPTPRMRVPSGRPDPAVWASAGQGVCSGALPGYGAGSPRALVANA